MASIEQRGDWFRIIFRHEGKRYTHTLKTDERRQAETLKGGIEHTLMLLEQRLVSVPEGADFYSFVVSRGQVIDKPKAEASSVNGQGPKQSISLRELKDRYSETHAIGALEESSLATVKMHLDHFIATFGADFGAQELTLARLQEHVNRRAKARGFRNRPLSPVTMHKEIGSLRAVWNWSVRMGLLEGTFPHRGLVYPKTDEKPPFQTWEEIARQIATGQLSEQEQGELWDCLFLTVTEIAELLTFVRDNARLPFLYPMICFAAHTGARRSEIIGVRKSDLDLDAGTVRIHEKKRVRGKRTTRRVALSPFLVNVIRDWLVVHPGGMQLFCHSIVVPHSNKERTQCMALTRNEAHDHFKRTFAGSKWAVLRGWHVLRHSFISNCAARGIDQRMLDKWVGHTTEEMRKRYFHLIPSDEKQAIMSVFALA